MRSKILLRLCVGLFVASLAPHAFAADGTVLGYSSDVDELELYKSPTDDDAAHILGKGELSVPTPILAISNNGMYKFKHKGGEYWVISDDVKSDMTRKVDTACDPKMAGSVVAHGKRGAGEACQ